MKTQMDYTYSIRSAWKERIETPAAIGARFVRTLDALTDIDPIFGKWEVFDHRNLSSLSLAAARERVAALFETNVTRDNLDNPEPHYGYSASAMAGEFRDPRSVSFMVNAGGRFDNRIWLEFGAWNVPPDLAVVTYPLFKKALLAIDAIWRTPWLCAYAFRLGTVAVSANLEGVEASRIESLEQVPSDLTFPQSAFHIPWIAFLSAELAVGVALPREIPTERTPDGGLLMIATEERLDPTNPEHVRRARILAETLIARTATGNAGTP